MNLQEKTRCEQWVRDTLTKQLGNEWEQWLVEREWEPWSQERRQQWSVACEKVKMGAQGNEEGLAQFLEANHQYNNWPILANEQWKEFVRVMLNGLEEQQIICDVTRLVEGRGNGLRPKTSLEWGWPIYRKYLQDIKHWNQDSIEECEKSATSILRRLNLSPNEHRNDNQNNEPVKGLVLGYVQSGKTANMEAIMSMAADSGVNFFIILSGTIDKLRDQTSERMIRDLQWTPENQNGRERQYAWRPLNARDDNTEVGQRAQDIFTNIQRTKVLTVCLKNSTRLKNLIKWIHRDENAHNNMRIMIIDDEADQASISNTVNSGTRRGINKLIVDLVEDRHYEPEQTRGHAQYINYVMYTATPYANFLNEGPYNESLYPKDFIISLNPSSEYIGPNQISWNFFDEDGNAIVSEDDIPNQNRYTEGLRILRQIDVNDIAIMNDLQPKRRRNVARNENQRPLADDLLPESLIDSFCWFLCSVSLIRHQETYKGPVSMMIHTSMKQDYHKVIARHLLAWINGHDEDYIITRCSTVYERERNTLPLASWKTQYPEYGHVKARDGVEECWPAKDAIMDYEDFGLIEDGIREMLRNDFTEITLNEDNDVQFDPDRLSPYLMVDNCSNENDYERLQYPDTDVQFNVSPAFIVIGGNTLARGLTIEGLVSTFFYRDSKQCDTLMQMGRWFGYRRNYELLPRIWMNALARDKFYFMAEDIEKGLRDNLRKYAERGDSPSEYGPEVRLAIAALHLNPTARNHMTNAKLASANYQGTNPQITTFENDVVVQQENVQTIERFINNLGDPIQSWNQKSLYWNDVQVDRINALLGDFHFSANETLFSLDLFSNWINKPPQPQEGEPPIDLSRWNVIVAGNGKFEENANNQAQNPSEYWNLGEYYLKKVERSRKDDGNESLINIGALSNRPDRLADISPETMEQAEQARIDLNTNKNIHGIRTADGRDKIPQLIIYRINKDSQPRNDETGRRPLGIDSDIIGLWFCLPGEKGGRGTITVDMRRQPTEQ